jgi:hypothetical protein
VLRPLLKKYEKPADEALRKVEQKVKETVKQNM